jgi:hypothetical protein
MESRYIKFDISNSKIFVNTPKNFRNKLWGKEFGILYHFFQGENDTTGFEFLEINLSNCVWIDPIPLLSLLVLIKQRVLIKKENIIFILPHINKSINDESKVLLKFLKQEGFITLIKECGVISNEQPKFENDIDKLVVSLNYFDCHLFNAKIVDTYETHDSDAEFYRVIGEFIDEIKLHLKNKKIFTQKVDDVIYRIRTFLAETINNVYQHAYGNTTPNRFAGIYTRYRYGLQNSAIEKEEKYKLKDLVTKEWQNSAKITHGLKEIFETKEGFIEIFVIDVGKGISEALGYRNNPRIKHPTRKAFIDIFETEQRKNISTDKNQTNIGGLAFIGKLIELQRDFLLNKDREDWLGGLLPDLRQGGYFESIPENDTHTLGCIWQASLSWNSINLNVDNWTNISGNSQRFLNLYKSKRVSVDLLQNYIIIDERIIHHPNWNKREEFIKQKSKGKDSINTIIYLPQKGVTKHLLGFVILRYLAENCKESTNLIIADIPDEERPTYSEALISSTYRWEFKELIKKIPSIILISNTLSVSALRFSDNSYEVDLELVNQFINDDFSALSLYKVLEVIITFDSLTIWQDVIKKNVNAFLNQLVFWNKKEKISDIDEYIDGYLDFNQICEVPAFIKLFEIGIQRIIGLYKNYSIDVSHLDLLTENISNRFQTKLIRNSDLKELNILIGSVLVKGFTMEEGAYNILNEKLIIHCFHHPSSNTESILKLFYWPKKSWLNDHFPSDDKNHYKRIGRTHAIAIGGWLAYEVPRYDEKNNSFYGATPKQSYKIWQDSKLGLSIGNFRYGNYSDLIKIDMRTIIDNAFYFKDNLARFIVKHFFTALGGTNENDLIDKEYWNFIKDCELGAMYSNVGIVIYPNHFYANYVIEKLANVLKTKLLENIIPLNFVRNNHSKTNLLFSPLSFSLIKELLSGTKKEALFFDDAIVTGRTRKEVKHLLFHLGATEVKSLAIIDRQRLPYSIPNPKTNKFYWRIDIPRLGSNINNPINNSLKKANEFQFKIIPDASYRIDDWNETWQNKLVTISNFSNVLSPISINLSKPSKKFGVRYNQVSGDYEQIGNESNEIFIHTSIGLIIYCLEMHCITGRDDLALKYCSENIQDSVKIELVCCYLLLYGNEIRPSMRIELLRKLLTFTNYSEPDNHTIFAALTILSLNENDFIKFSEIQEIKNNCNIDMQISFAIQTLIVDLKEESFESYHNIIAVSKQKSTIRLINRLDFHRQIYNKRSAHISPIHAVINKRKLREKRFYDFKIALNKLTGHITDFPQDIFPAILNKEQLLENVNLFKYKVSNFFSSLQERNNIVSELIQKQIEDSIESELLTHLEYIHGKLFLQINHTNSPLKSLVRNICNEYSRQEWLEIAEEKGCKKFIEEHNDLEYIAHQIKISAIGIETRQEIESNKYSPIWIPFDEEIMYHLKNMVTNYLHGTYELIEDPFSFHSSMLKAHLWYSFQIDSKNLKFIIELANSIPKNSNCKDRAENSPNIRQINNFLQLGCEVEFSEIELGSNMVLITRFSLPII